MAQNLAPIYKLLRTNLSSGTRNVQKPLKTKILIHYDPQIPAKLEYDATNKGIGAAIFYTMLDSTDRAIAFASKVVSKTEQYDTNTPRTISFAHYLIRRTFILQTHHGPALAIFRYRKGILAIAARRLQRWSIYLSNFNFSIKSISGSCFMLLNFCQDLRFWMTTYKLFKFYIG